MAKALLGHVGRAPDRRLLEELAFLRARVRRLQAELEELRAERAAAELELGVPDTAPVRYAEALPV